jgi:hypothetical protein
VILEENFEANLVEEKYGKTLYFLTEFEYLNSKTTVK